ncbi:hypothetical protein DFA_01396 [Cavenderia fasciculata]|uniref:Uncharacterized protein n=1 Tax=Cavenderia fasciculata TaxID=261658 RepID=F4PSI0_CACFS|nr:uncharacterized protein DFA_01396 [Cavenderia fasciculata]EGG21510.1 hypothetical protein DFA_01396 [Cavenderia fasciculata]|eukprot:XP_004359360.1 hypothetical protein DFA_01396 [Cavenderia fasciculata]
MVGFNATPISTTTTSTTSITTHYIHSSGPSFQKQQQQQHLFGDCPMLHLEDHFSSISLDSEHHHHRYDTLIDNQFNIENLVNKSPTRNHHIETIIRNPELLILENNNNNNNNSNNDDHNRFETMVAPIPQEEEETIYQLQPGNHSSFPNNQQQPPDEFLNHGIDFTLDQIQFYQHQQQQSPFLSSKLGGGGGLRGWVLTSILLLSLLLFISDLAIAFLKDCY